MKIKIKFIIFYNLNLIILLRNYRENSILTKIFLNN